MPTEGLWTWRIRAFTDEWATWFHNAEIKIPAGKDVELMLTIGRELLERAAEARDREARARDARRPGAHRRPRMGGARGSATHRAVQTRPLMALDDR